MPTGQVIVSNALTALGLLDQGGTPSVSDSTDALGELNSMWQAWGIDEGLIFSVQSQDFAWSGGLASHAIGPAAAAPFNVAVPARIYNAIIPGSTGRTALKIVDQVAYFEHNDLGATAVCPDELYPDYDIAAVTGSMTLYLWPKPSGTITLELETAATFSTWMLTTAYAIPQGYQDAIQYALAWRLIPRYGAVVDPKVAQVIAELGQKAEHRIRSMNVLNRQINPQVAGLQQQQPAQPGVQQ